MKTTRALLTAAVLTFSSAAQASLIGDTVTCSFAGTGATCSTPSAVVLPAAPEFTINNPTPLFTIDIGASSITISLDVPRTTVTFGSLSQVLTLGSLDDPAGDIIGIANFTTALTTGIAASDVSFTADSVSFTFTNSGWQSGSVAAFDVVFTGAAVPEPSSLGLIGLAVGLLGVIRRRKPA